MNVPVCQSCREVTYPMRWCECDPRFQLAAAADRDTDVVILMPDPPPFEDPE